MVCEQCGRSVDPAQARCLWCGTPVRATSDAEPTRALRPDEEPTRALPVGDEATRALPVGEGATGELPADGTEPDEAEVPPDPDAPPAEWFRDPARVPTAAAAEPPTRVQPLTTPAQPLAAAAQPPTPPPPPITDTPAAAPRGRSPWPLLIAVVVAAVALVALLATRFLNMDFPSDEPAASSAPTAAAPTPTKSATPTPTPTPAPASSAAPSTSASTPTESPTFQAPDGASQCSDDVWVNSATTCEFAAVVAGQVDRNMTTPVVFDAVSPVTNQTYQMACVRSETLLIECANDGTARVYIRAAG